MIRAENSRTQHDHYQGYLWPTSFHWSSHCFNRQWGWNELNKHDIVNHMIQYSWEYHRKNRVVSSSIQIMEEIWWYENRIHLANESRSQAEPLVLHCWLLNRVSQLLLPFSASKSWYRLYWRRPFIWLNRSWPTKYIILGFFMPSQLRHHQCPKHYWPEVHPRHYYILAN